MFKLFTVKLDEKNAYVCFASHEQDYETYLCDVRCGQIYTFDDLKNVMSDILKYIARELNGEDNVRIRVHVDGTQDTIMEEVEEMDYESRKFWKKVMRTCKVDDDCIMNDFE